MSVLLAVVLGLGQISNLAQVSMSNPTVPTANNVGTCVSVTTSSTVILPIYLNRRVAILTAPSANTATVFVKLGGTATSSNFPLVAGAALNLAGNVVYSGTVDGIAASGTQSVCVLEW